MAPPPAPAPPRPQRWPVELALTKPEADSLRRHARAYPGLAVRQRRARTYRTAVAAPVLGYQPAAAGQFLYLAQRLRARPLLPPAQQRGGRLLQRAAGGPAAAPPPPHRRPRPSTRQLGRRYRLPARPGPASQPQPGPASLRRAPAGPAARLHRGPGAHHGRNSLLRIGAHLRPRHHHRTPAAMLSGGRSFRILTSRLLNRPAVLAGPPGSVFKLVNAAVALQLGDIQPDYLLCLRPVAHQLLAPAPARPQPRDGPQVQLQPVLLPGAAGGGGAPARLGRHTGPIRWRPATRIWRPGGATCARSGSTRCWA
ncbi:MAG: hypothetical protein WKG07_07475 [Hymenobacter sp.]